MVKSNYQKKMGSKYTSDELFSEEIKPSPFAQVLLELLSVLYEDFKVQDIMNCLKNNSLYLNFLPYGSENGGKMPLNVVHGWTNRPWRLVLLDSLVASSEIKARKLNKFGKAL